MLILNLSDVEISLSFFWKKCENSTLKIRHFIDINWSGLKSLQIQGRFKNYFSKIYEKIYDEQIFTSLSFKISPILSTNFCHPKTHNLTEVWTQLKNGVNTICTIFLR